MRELALHILDVLQNAVEAGASRVALEIVEDPGANRLAITASDNGRGMDAATAARATDPFFTSRTTRHVGLGLPLLRAAAERAGGSLALESVPGAGTTVRADFQYHHADRQPLGDMGGTLLAFLLAENAPDLNYTHRAHRGGEWLAYEFDSGEIKATLGDVPLGHPAVRRWLADFLEQGERMVCQN